MNNTHHRNRHCTIQASVMPLHHAHGAGRNRERTQDHAYAVGETEANVSSSARKSGQWKRAVIGMLVVTLLVPIMGWFALALLGNVWIDDKQLNAFYLQVQEAKPLSNGQPIVRTDDMPAYVTETLLAIEDHRYFMHSGVDPVGIARSVWAGVVKGSKSQGGSTITMQLARNLFLTHEKTYVRKMKEIAIAANLELRYTKQELVDMYLNKVYFGHGKYGIESAARYYFGKTTKVDGDRPTINIAETAMLVGLLKAPEHYSPFKNEELAEKRQRVVLHRMNELGWITEVELQQALKTPLVYGAAAKKAA